QQGVCKIAVFAYDRMSGRPVWQSGNRKVASRAKDIWLMGAGPFQKGTIYDGTSFAGEKFAVPLVNKRNAIPNSSVAQEKMFGTEGRFPREKKRGEANTAAYRPNATAPAAGTPPAAPAAAPAAAASGTATPAAATAPAAPKPAYTPPPPPPV